MSRSPISRALGGTLIALGLVVATAPMAATANADSEKPTTAQLPAMQRDLGLTKAEATDLLDLQEQARATERTLAKRLGSDFGGAVFDIDSGALTVSVTDAGSVPAVEDAGAEARVVDNGEAALDAIVADLNKVKAAERVTGWHTDLAKDTVVVTVLKGATKSAEAMVAKAGVDASDVTIKETTKAPVTYADIVGGNAYYIGSGRCSVGFSVTGGFVTAGHCGATGARTTSPTGTVAASHFPNTDMAWVRTTSADTPTPYVNNYSGGRVAVRGSSEAGNGSSICRSGSTTGWRCGTVVSKNQTVNYGGGQIVYGLTRTTACADRGDSGGSWITGDQAQGVTSGGRLGCSGGQGETYFQPLNPILSRYSLTLRTV
ncbi:streptogrisin C [Murinocardiopsis flavida]|uniref:Streptogrisin C n=1 Tax=Murinocardiopsis flavida TaxID=645275 RepID=A0A2P8DL97_9ACTN|nr:S1 family peptidase [Murinocardiopsis flavida]PSK97995.1 streptogrisin C [Murinocardiopsis flavida]